MMKVANLIDKKDLPAFFKAFGIGLIVIAFFYIGLGGGAYIAKDKLAEKRQARLAGQTVLIEHLSEKKSVEQGSSEDEGAVQQTDTAHESTTAEAHPAAETVETKEEETETTTHNVAANKAGPQRIEADPLVVQEYYESAATGPLPKLTREHKSVFNLYKYPFDKAMLLEHPSIALIMADYGLSATNSDDALSRIGAPVSFILSPYSRAPKQWTDKAHEKGHEIWMSLPLEPALYPQEDPGPHTLLVSAPEQKNLEKLQWLMSRTKGVIGFVKTGNTAFNTAPTDLRPLLGELYRRGFAYLGDRNDATDSLARSMAKGSGAPFSGRMIMLDDVPNHDSISTALKELEEEAQKHGSAIGLFHPHPVTLALISKWTDQIASKGTFTLAPASAIAEIRR